MGSIRDLARDVRFILMALFCQSHKVIQYDLKRLYLKIMSGLVGSDAFARYLYYDALKSCYFSKIFHAAAFSN